MTAPRGMPSWVKILLPVAAAATAVTGAALAMHGDPTSTAPTTSAPATTVAATNVSDRRMTKTVGRTLAAAEIPRPSDDPATPQTPNQPAATTAAPTDAPGATPETPTTVGRTTVPATTTPVPTVQATLPQQTTVPG